MLNEFESILKSKHIPIDTNGHGWKLPSVAYRKFVHHVLFYLGMFIDEKYFADIRLGDATFWYDESYTKYEKLFVSEKHYLRYFRLLYNKTYDSRERSSKGFHPSDQERYAKIVSQKGYMEAYLALVPLLDASFHSEKYISKKLLTYGLQLDHKLAKQTAARAYLNKTTHYSYSHATDMCVLTKSIEIYDVLKDSILLAEYMDLTLKQLEIQCTPVQRWGYYPTHDKSFQEAFCYMKKNPKWLETIKLDTDSVRGYILDKEYCMEINIK